MIPKDRATALSPLDLFPVPSTGSNSAGDKKAFDFALRSSDAGRNSSDGRSRSDSSRDTSSTSSNSNTSNNANGSSNTRARNERSDRKTDVVKDRSAAVKEKEDKSDAKNEAAEALAGAAGVQATTDVKSDASADANDKVTAGSENTEAINQAEEAATSASPTAQVPTELVPEAPPVEPALEVDATTILSEDAKQKLAQTVPVAEEVPAAEPVTLPTPTESGAEASAAKDAAAAKAEADGIRLSHLQSTQVAEVPTPEVSEAAMKQAAEALEKQVSATTESSDAKNTKEDGGEILGDAGNAVGNATAAAELTAVQPASASSDNASSGSTSDGKNGTEAIAGKVASKIADAPKSSSSSNQAITSGPHPPKLPASLLGKAEGTQHVRSTPEIDLTRFVHRVAKALETASQRDGEVRLRLSPPELGSVRLSMTVQDGVMVAKMETETTAAQAIITDNLAALRERLAEQGIRVERFDVDLMNQSQSGAGTRQDQQMSRDADFNNGRRGSTRSGIGGNVVNESRVKTPTVVDGTSGLNVVV